jgi:hypothetical protein
MVIEALQRKPARIHFKDGQVIVCPEDQDVFLISASKAIEACQQAVRQDEILHHFKTTLLKPLSDWAESKAEQLQALYLARTNSTHIYAYAVTKSERYDFELTKELADLDLSFGDQGWSISIHQIPKTDEENLTNFFDPARALQIYG